MEKVASFFLLSTVVLSSNFAKGYDRQHAAEALGIVGVDVGNGSGQCGNCHGLEASDIRRWGSALEAVDSYCLGNPQLTTAHDKIECLKNLPSPDNDPSGFEPVRLGLYTAAAHLRDFEDLFRAAYAPEEWQTRYDEFQNAVAMPRNGAHLDGESFEKIRTWVKAGMPFLDEILAPGNTQACREEITAELSTHVAAMATDGWAVKNRERGMHMYGCATDDQPLHCLTQKTANGTDIFEMAPELATYGGRTTVRHIKDFTTSSQYWIRSSPDGSIVGRSNPSELHDLSSLFNVEMSPRVVTIASRDWFDPTFFPDGTGFAFYNNEGNVKFCHSSILAISPSVTKITFTEAQCGTIGEQGGYQYLAASLDGQDYYVVSSAYHNDRSGNGSSSSFGDGFIRINRMINNGRKFIPQSSAILNVSREGDLGASPSGRLVISRVDTASGGGYLLRAIKPASTQGRFNFTAPTVGRVCLNGNKASFSYNERSFVTHRAVERMDFDTLGYSSPNDPEFAPLIGKTNVFLYDFMTKKTYGLTRMVNGAATFPHFRSDGWIYFLVKDGTGEHVYASDAAIRIWNGEI